MKTAILFVTHVMNGGIKREIEKLREGSAGLADFYVGYQADGIPPEMPEGVRAFPFTLRDLNLLGYRSWGCRLMDGNFHFVPLYFYSRFPDYDYYWLVEYDVRFNGDWRTFFSFFEDKEEDFVSAHLETVEDNPDWIWWKALELLDIPLGREMLRRSFNPICRFSNRALGLLHGRCLLGDRGHNEVLMPTLFHHYRLRMADLGGRGRYSYKECPDLFYKSVPGEDGTESCTHRFRPAHTECSMTEADMIYHPVK